MQAGHRGMQGEFGGRAVELQQGIAVQREPTIRSEGATGGGVSVVAGLLMRQEHLKGVDPAAEKEADQGLGIGSSTKSIRGGVVRQLEVEQGVENGGGTDSGAVELAEEAAA